MAPLLAPEATCVIDSTIADVDLINVLIKVYGRLEGEVGSSAVAVCSGGRRGLGSRVWSLRSPRGGGPGLSMGPTAWREAGSKHQPQKGKVP